MPRGTLTAINIAKSVAEATKAFDSSDGALDRLLEMSAAAVGAAGSAVFRAAPNGDPVLVAGRDSRLLKDKARLLLKERIESSAANSPDKGDKSAGPAFGRILYSNGLAIGVWAVLLPGTSDIDVWNGTAEALAPLMSLGLRERSWHQEVRLANIELERRIREVGTVYEIGRAIDKVDNDQLLRLITERAAAVMDAQACSLMMRQPGTNHLYIAASYGLPDYVVENTEIDISSGIAGRVVSTGEPLLLQSVPDGASGERRVLEGMPGASSISMPIKDESGDVLGVLSIRRSATAHSFTDDDLRLFGIFATHATLAINNSQLYQKLNNKLQELSTLAALTKTISSTLDLDQVLNQVADNIVDVVRFDRCQIYLSDIDTGRFSARIVRGFPQNAELAHYSNIGLGEGLVGIVAQRQTPLLVEDPSSAPPIAAQFAYALRLRGFYAQPIVQRGRCIGVVVVGHSDPTKPLAQSNIELLSTFVNQAGIAIENARFYAGKERRYAELATLYDVSRTLSATSGIHRAAQTVNDLATRITDSDAGVLLLLDGNQDALRALHWLGVSEPLERRLRAATLAVPVARNARAVCVPRILNADDAGQLFGPEWQPFCDAFLARHRSVALVPLVVENNTVGFILLGKHRAEYGVEELKLIAVASSQAATVLQSAADYERRIDQRDLELSAVYELMQRLRDATTLEEALNSILDIVASQVWSEESALYTVDPGGRTLTVRAAKGADAAGIVGVRTLALDDENIAAKALRERRALIASGDESEGAGSPYSSLAIPLVVGDEMVGVLSLGSSRPRVYTEESAMMLHLVTSQAATIYREMSSFRVLTRYTENILRSIAAGVMTIDKDGIIVTWNARAEEIVNLRADEIVGLHYVEFIRRLQVEPAVRNETMRMMELTAHTGKVFTRNQLCYQMPHGEETYVNLSASQLKSESGEYLGVVVVFEDVTYEVQMKEEVERISKLAETGQLAANIAHELRNPLSSIKGAAQILRNELPPDYVTAHGEFLDIIIDEVNGLNRMTTEFLEFSRAIPPQMEVVSLNGLLSRILQFMSAYFKGASVSIDLDLSEALPPLYMDRTQIEQVVRNIVINAAQAMPSGGNITVTTRYNADQDIAEAAFTDTGVGIPANKLERIFTPFFTTKTKGTGLGLAIARKIVDTHGGRLSVRSTPGDGSTFTMQLPVRPQHTGLLPPGRNDITHQRSDQPGGSFKMPADNA